MVVSHSRIFDISMTTTIYLLTDAVHFHEGQSQSHRGAVCRASFGITRSIEESGGDQDGRPQTMRTMQVLLAKMFFVDTSLDIEELPVHIIGSTMIVSGCHAP